MGVKDGFVCFTGGLDIISRPLNGTAENHAEDHPKDLWRDEGCRNTELV